MISKKIINKFKYLGVERYEEYKNKFDELDKNELIELKAEYEANVNANRSKELGPTFILILGFICWGAIGMINKFIYKFAIYKSDYQQALNIMKNFTFLEVILILVIFIILILYNKAVKKNYMKLYYINQYLKDKKYSI